MLLAAALAGHAAPASGCNPNAPVPPVLEEHGYDDVARKVLMTQAGTIAMARLLTRVDLLFESDGPTGSAELPTYQFDVKDGWKAPGPRRLSLGGHWVSCDLDLKPGAWFLIFLQGDWPLYIRPAEDSSVDLQILGEIQWFYTPSGQLILPELVEDVPQSPRGTSGDAPEETAIDIVSEPAGEAADPGSTAANPAE